MTAAGSRTSSKPESDGPEERPAGGPPPWIAVLAIGGLALGALLIVLQLVGINVIAPAPSPTIPPTGQAAQRTADQVQAALQAAQFQVQVPQTAYRPGESPALVAVPRQLLPAILPSDPDGGYVVIYELPSNDDADRVGRDFARYLASGTGAIQYPRDTQFVIQRVGPTLVFYPWSAEANPDPRVPQLAAALRTVGEPVTP
jgi:hypothetical protein